MSTASARPTTEDIRTPPAPHPPERPRPELEEPGPWREAFVRQFRDRDNRAALRRFGVLLQSMERDEAGSAGEIGCSWLHRELGAVAADLAAACFIVREIAELGEEDLDQLEEPDRHLPDRTRTWADALDRLVREIEAALDAVQRKRAVS